MKKENLRKCRSCGKEFRPYFSYQRFCSRRCFNTSRRGKPRPKKVRKKISEALRGRTPWSKGKKLPPSCRRKMAKTKMGVRNPQWRGGISHDYLNRISKKYNLTKCFVCGSSNAQMHHIDGDAKNNEIDNLIPLCPPHHKHIHGLKKLTLPTTSCFNCGIGLHIIPARIKKAKIGIFCSVKCKADFLRRFGAPAFRGRIWKIPKKTVKEHVSKLDKLRGDPILFVKNFLNFVPFPYQERLLKDMSPRQLAVMGRQVGKTHTTAAKAIYLAYTKPNFTILVVSPSMRQSGILFDRILSLIYSSKILPKSIVRQTRTIIQLSNGSHIIALPCSENMLRGYTAHTVIVDEAAFVKDEVIAEIMMPMLATTQGHLLLLSTPWNKDSFFYRAFSNPNFSVHRVKSSECPLISEEFLSETRSMMTSEQFAREYLAEFSEAAATYFSQSLIRECVLKAQAMGTHFETHIERFNFPDAYGGIDLGKIQDNSVISAIERDGSLYKLVFHKQFPLKTPYAEIIGAVRRMHQLAPFKSIAVDRTGVGEAVTEELKSLDATILPIKGVLFTRQRKADILGHLRIVMEQRNLVLPYDRELCAQMNDQRFEYTKSGTIRFWHPEGAHDDRLWSLALAVYAARGGEPTAPPVSIAGP